MRPLQCKEWTVENALGMPEALPPCSAISKVNNLISRRRSGRYTGMGRKCSAPVGVPQHWLSLPGILQSSQFNAQGKTHCCRAKRLLAVRFVESSPGAASDVSGFEATWLVLVLRPTMGTCTRFLPPVRYGHTVYSQGGDVWVRARVRMHEHACEPAPAQHELRW